MRQRTPFGKDAQEGNARTAAEPHELIALRKLGASEVLTMPWDSTEMQETLFN